MSFSDCHPTSAVGPSSEEDRPTAAVATAAATSSDYFELEPNAAAGAPPAAAAGASFLPVWSSLFQQSPPRSSRSQSHLTTTNSDLLKESLHAGGGGDAGEKSHRRDRLSGAAVIAALVLLLLIISATTVGALISPSVRHAIFGTPEMHVAFIGNSIMYYYDLPRSLQIVSNYRIQQNSCLSGAGSLVRMPTLQNGMWNRWRSDGALLETLDDDEVSSANNNNYDNSFYDNRVWDLGACTMEMLLFGYNHTEAQQNYYDFWDYRQEHGVTDDDEWVYDYGSDLDPRLNDACAQSQTYLDFLNDLPNSDLRKNPTRWDYLVLVDRTSGPKNQNSRDSGLSALDEIYLPFFQRTKATPVLLVSASYWKDRDDDDDDDYYDYDDDDDSTSTALDQIPSFTFEMYQGYVQYAEFLKAALPRSQKPRLINMGLAYLVVYEENLDLWYSLFWTDNKHPSPHGNFLESCLLHHVVYGRVPYKSTVIRDDMQSLWNGTRDLMYPRNEVVPFPTKEEAEYLYAVCKRVAGGYIPSTFQEQLLKNGLSLYK